MSNISQTKQCTFRIRDYKVNRFADFQSYIKQLATFYGLNLKQEVTVGWFFEKGSFEVSGPSHLVRAFIRRFEAAINHYNGDVV